MGHSSRQAAGNCLEKSVRKEPIMTELSSESVPEIESRSRFICAPHRSVVGFMWLVSTVTMVTMLCYGIKSTGKYEAFRYMLHVGYVTSLLWFLIRTGSYRNRLPELKPQVLPRWKYGAWIPVLGILLLFALTAISDDGVDILILFLMISCVWILLVWFRNIRIRTLVQGFTLALIAFFTGLVLVNNRFVGETVLYLLAGLSFPLYVAGGLLCQRTRLGGVQLLEARYGEAVKSLCWGGLLFIPLGLFNAAGGSPGSGITWVTKWWMPFTIPWFSGIAEEALFRLFLIGLCYFFLRPAFRRHPSVAVVIAVLFSATTFGLGHERTLEKFVTTGLLYGLPMAVIFAKRDWEHAIGAHYMINMIPWTIVFLETL